MCRSRKKNSVFAAWRTAHGVCLLLFVRLHKRGPMGSRLNWQSKRTASFLTTRSLNPFHFEKRSFEPKRTSEEAIWLGSANLFDLIEATSFDLHGPTVPGSVAKLDRKQIRLLHDEPQPHRLASE